MALEWYSASRTDVGKVRRVNEDALLERSDIGLWVVADGMGGHAAGDVASQIVVSAFEHLSSSSSLEALAFDVRERLDQANRTIRDEVRRRGNATMGSTVVALLVHGNRCLCLWAGDSRAYLLRRGEFVQITRDHSIVEELIQAGELRPEDADGHPQANVITRAVGGDDELVVDEWLHEVEEGDRVLLCSDGLNKELDDTEIAVIVGDNDCDQATALLVDTALERGARDNVTVAVIEFPSERDPTVVLGT